MIRHTTPDIEQGIIYGKRLEVPLSSNFPEDANKLKYIKNILPCPVYCSPSTRCTYLADFLFKSKYTIDPRLSELDFGDWEGKKWDDIPKSVLDKWMKNYEEVAPPNGESLAQMRSRVVEFINEISDIKMDRVVLITHAGVIRIVLSLFSGKNMNELCHQKIEYGEVFVVQQK